MARKPFNAAAPARPVLPIPTPLTRDERQEIVCALLGVMVDHDEQMRVEQAQREWDEEIGKLGEGLTLDQLYALVDKVKML